jgi:hypothetical protein
MGHADITVKNDEFTGPNNVTEIDCGGPTCSDCPAREQTTGLCKPSTTRSLILQINGTDRPE